MSNFVLFILATLASVSAQILTRQGMTQQTNDVIASLLSWQVFAALVCYALAFVCYALFLARVELSLAAPLFVGGTIILLQVYGQFTGEHLDIYRIVGAVLVIAGVTLLSLSMHKGAA
ncbi:MAG: hypothetical protein OEZ43_06260 [Gammaproteobacteria bacterium]|nr:hypothetical protein [Gammaproteobacteria bacterium]